MKKVKNADEYTHFLLKNGIIWLCLVFISFGIINTLSAEDLITGINIVSREKTRVEDAGLALIKANGKSSAEYRVGKSYYTEACASFNGWIDSIIFALKTGKGPEEIDTNINILSSAIEKSDKFYYYVFPPSKSPSLFQTGYEFEPSSIFKVGSIVTKIVKWLIDTWDNKNKELIKQLDGLKIKSFVVLESEIK